MWPNVGSTGFEQGWLTQIENGGPRRDKTQAIKKKLFREKQTRVRGGWFVVVVNLTIHWRIGSQEGT